MAAVHFTNKESLVDAFRNKGIPYFAVVSGSLIIHKNQKIDDVEDAATELDSFLDMLNQGSNAVYVLRIYEAVPSGGIKDKTPADYGLNFRLNIDGMLPEPSRIAYLKNRDDYDKRLMERLEAIEAKINGVDDEDAEDEQPAQTGLAGVLNGLISNPAIQQALISRLIGLVDKFLPPVNPTIMSGSPAINGINEEQKTLDNALTILRKHCPNLEEKLMALANLAEAEPAQFQMLIKML